MLFSDILNSDFGVQNIFSIAFGEFHCSYATLSWCFFIISIIFLSACQITYVYTVLFLQIQAQTSTHSTHHAQPWPQPPVRATPKSSHHPHTDTHHHLSLTSVTTKTITITTLPQPATTMRLSCPFRSSRNRKIANPDSAATSAENSSRECQVYRRIDSSTQTSNLISVPSAIKASYANPI